MEKQAEENRNKHKLSPWNECIRNISMNDSGIMHSESSSVETFITDFA
jgi:hypothetical protein